MTTSRERFLALKNKRRFSDLELPELGLFRVRSLLEGERAEVEQLSGDARMVKRALVVFGLIEHKTPAAVFTPDDVDELAELDSTLVDTIAAAVLAVNQSNDLAALLGELAGSCNTTSSSDSPIGSPHTSESLIPSTES